MTKILKSRKINPGGSVKKFNERFKSQIERWKDLYAVASHEMGLLNKNNILHIQ